jgi:hypothetical protein
MGGNSPLERKLSIPQKWCFSPRSARESFRNSHSSAQDSGLLINTLRRNDNVLALPRAELSQSTGLAGWTKAALFAPGDAASLAHRGVWGLSSFSEFPCKIVLRAPTRWANVFCGLQVRNAI